MSDVEIVYEFIPGSATTSSAEFNNNDSKKRKQGELNNCEEDGIPSKVLKIGEDDKRRGGGEGESVRGVEIGNAREREGRTDIRGGEREKQNERRNEMRGERERVELEQNTPGSSFRKVTAEIEGCEVEKEENEEEKEVEDTDEEEDNLEEVIEIDGDEYDNQDSDNSYDDDWHDNEDEEEEEEEEKAIELDKETSDLLKDFDHFKSLKNELNYYCLEFLNCVQGKEKKDSCRRALEECRQAPLPVELIARHSKEGWLLKRKLSLLRQKQKKEFANCLDYWRLVHQSLKKMSGAQKEKANSGRLEAKVDNIDKQLSVTQNLDTTKQNCDNLQLQENPQQQEEQKEEEELQTEQDNEADQSQRLDTSSGKMKPKTTRVCPFCSAHIKNMSSHLITMHKWETSEEELPDGIKAFVDAFIKFRQSGSTIKNCTHGTSTVLITELLNFLFKQKQLTSDFTGHALVSMFRERNLFLLLCHIGSFGFKKFKKIILACTQAVEFMVKTNDQRWKLDAQTAVKVKNILVSLNEKTKKLDNEEWAQGFHEMIESYLMSKIIRNKILQSKYVSCEIANAVKYFDPNYKKPLQYKEFNSLRDALITLFLVKYVKQPRQISEFQLKQFERRDMISENGKCILNIGFQQNCAQELSLITLDEIEIRALEAYMFCVRKICSNCSSPECFVFIRRSWSEGKGDQCCQKLATKDVIKSFLKIYQHLSEDPETLDESMLFPQEQNERLLNEIEQEERGEETVQERAEEVTEGEEDRSGGMVDSKEHLIEDLEEREQETGIQEENEEQEGAQIEREEQIGVKDERVHQIGAQLESEQDGEEERDTELQKREQQILVKEEREEQIGAREERVQQIVQEKEKQLVVKEDMEQQIRARVEREQQIGIQEKEQQLIIKEEGDYQRGEQENQQIGAQETRNQQIRIQEKEHQIIKEEREQEIGAQDEEQIGIKQEREQQTRVEEKELQMRINEKEEQKIDIQEEEIEQMDVNEERDEEMEDQDEREEGGAVEMELEAIEEDIKKEEARRGNKNNTKNLHLTSNTEEDKREEKEQHVQQEQERAVTLPSTPEAFESSVITKQLSSTMDCSMSPKIFCDEFYEAVTIAIELVKEKLGKNDWSTVLKLCNEVNPKCTMSKESLKYRYKNHQKLWAENQRKTMLDGAEGKEMRQPSNRMTWPKGCFNANISTRWFLKVVMMASEVTKEILGHIDWLYVWELCAEVDPRFRQISKKKLETNFNLLMRNVERKQCRVKTQEGAGGEQMEHEETGKKMIEERETEGEEKEQDKGREEMLERGRINEIKQAEVEEEVEQEKIIIDSRSEEETDRYLIKETNEEECLLQEKAVALPPRAGASEKSVIISQSPIKRNGPKKNTYNHKNSKQFLKVVTMAIDVCEGMLGYVDWSTVLELCADVDPTFKPMSVDDVKEMYENLKMSK